MGSNGRQRCFCCCMGRRMSIQVIPETRKKNGSLTTIKLLIELNKHKIDVDKEEYSSKKYDIRFSDKVSCKGPTQFEMRSILGEKFQNDNTMERAIEDAVINVPSDSKDYAQNTKAIRAYLVRAILFTYFQSKTTGKLNTMWNYINNDYEISIEMLD